MYLPTQTEVDKDTRERKWHFLTNSEWVKEMMTPDYVNVLLTIKFRNSFYSEAAMEKRLYSIERAINRYLFPHANYKKAVGLFSYYAKPEISPTGHRHYHIWGYIDPSIRHKFLDETMYPQSWYENGLPPRPTSKIQSIVNNIGRMLVNRHNSKPSYHKAVMRIDNAFPDDIDKLVYWYYAEKPQTRKQFSNVVVPSQSAHLINNHRAVKTMMGKRSFFL